MSNARLALRIWAADLRDRGTLEHNRSAGMVVTLLDLLPRCQATNVRCELEATLCTLLGRLVLAGFCPTI